VVEASTIEGAPGRSGEGRPEGLEGARDADRADSLARVGIFHLLRPSGSEFVKGQAASQLAVLANVPHLRTEF
jgi:hypothetical protein